MTDISIIDELEEDIYTLTPIVCTFCESFVTYIEFDTKSHLFESHNIRSEYAIRNAIIQGRKLGNDFEKSIEKLDLEYSKYLDKTLPQVSTPDTVTAYNIMDGVRSWSQLIRVKNSFTFMPIVTVDEFFKDDHDKPYSALRNHSLEQSPCYPIIGARPARRHIMYYCEVCHPEFANDYAVANINKFYRASL